MVSLMSHHGVHDRLGAVLGHCQSDREVVTSRGNCDLSQATAAVGIH